MRNDPTSDTLVQPLHPAQRANRRLMRLAPWAQALLGSMLLIGQLTGPKLAEAQAPELATVKSAELAVYTETDSTSTVISSLMRGDLVEIDDVITTRGGVWCQITEIGGSGITGYVRCEALQRRPIRPSKPLRFIEQPTPKPKTEVPEHAEKRERGYAIQVASLVLEQNALALKARLEKLGFRPMIRTTTARITHHRVYAGEFSSREEATKRGQRLRRDGFPVKEVEIEGGKIGLEVGSSVRLNEAITLTQRLKKMQYTAKVVSGTAPTRVHQVRVGKYPSRAEALRVVQALKREGFEPLVVRQ